MWRRRRRRRNFDGDASTDMSGLGRGGRPRIIGGKSMNSVASGDACDGKLVGVDLSLEV